MGHLVLFRKLDCGYPICLKKRVIVKHIFKNIADKQFIVTL